MDVFKDLLIPVLIAVMTAVVTAIITIQIKYSVTKEDAFGGLKSLASKALYFFWVAFLIFSLFLFVSSDEPLTRADVFKISVTIGCLVLLLIIYFLKKIVGIFEMHSSLHHKHIALFEKHIQKYHSEKVEK